MIFQSLINIKNKNEIGKISGNDRFRYTISPQARKKVLKRLLLLKYKIYEEEVKSAPNKNKVTGD